MGGGEVSVPFSVSASVFAVVAGDLRVLNTTGFAVGDVFYHGQPGNI